MRNRLLDQSHLIVTKSINSYNVWVGKAKRLPERRTLPCPVNQKPKKIKALKEL